MKIEDYIDSTYLKTPEQAGISNSDTINKVKELTDEAIEHGFYAVMIRPDYLKFIRNLLDESKSKVKLGTVISFPEGSNSIEEKIREAQVAMANGADELDYVVNYRLFIKGDIETVKEEIQVCTNIGLKENRIVKWIIETAALTDEQIESLTSLISEVVTSEFGEEKAKNVFVKSSTGFFITPDNSPNGANEHVISLMLKNAGVLPVKASGGIKNLEDAKRMIELGVKRIGTSSALEICKGKNIQTDY